MGLEDRGSITSRTSIFSLNSPPYVCRIWEHKKIIVSSFHRGICHSPSYTSRITSTPLYTSRAYNLRRGSKFIVIFIFIIQLENLRKEVPSDISVLILLIYLSCVENSPRHIVFKPLCSSLSVGNEIL
jgi:hypothetical protein